MFNDDNKSITYLFWSLTKTINFSGKDWYSEWVIVADRHVPSTGKDSVWVIVADRHVPSPGVKTDTVCEWLWPIDMSPHLVKTDTVCEWLWLIDMSPHLVKTVCEWLWPIDMSLHLVKTDTVCEWLWLCREATHINFIVFGLTRAGLEPTIYGTRGEHDHHYTADAIKDWYLY